MFEHLTCVNPVTLIWLSKTSIDKSGLRCGLLFSLQKPHSLNCFKMQNIPREVNHLSSALSQLLLSGSEFKYVTVSNSILSLMIRNYDLSPLADKIIKLLALPYPPFKRVVCSFLKRYADKISNLNILTTNCFLKDFEDPNPFVRGLVIKTVCHIPCLHELAFQLIPLALCDSSSYVRSIAASSCSMIVDETNLQSKQNIIDILYDMIRDTDPSVISSSLAALNVILSSEGGVVINTRLACYLICRIHEFQEWHFSSVCQILRNYVPKTNDQLLNILNALDNNLSDSNALIFSSASQLALFYVSSLKENFSCDIIDQISPHIKFHSEHSGDELLYEILKCLHIYAIDYKKYFTSFYTHLICRFSDPIFIKVKKLETIIELGTVSNFYEIAEELLLHSCDSVKEVSIQSIKSFVKFLLLHSLPHNIVESFVQMMDIQYNNINEEVLIALCSSKLEDREDFKQVFLPSVSKISSCVYSQEGKLALLELIANHGKYIEKSPYLIENLINDSENIENERIMMMIVMASVKLFLVRPAEMQLLLGYVLQLTEQSSNLLLRKQCAIYNHLLNNYSLNNKILLTFQSENT